MTLQKAILRHLGLGRLIDSIGRLLDRSNVLWRNTYGDDPSQYDFPLPWVLRILHR